MPRFFALFLLNLVLIFPAHSQLMTPIRSCYKLNPLNIFSAMDEAKAKTKFYCDQLMVKSFECIPGEPACVEYSEIWDEVYPGQFTWVKFYSNGNTTDDGLSLKGGWSLCGIHIEKAYGDDCDPLPTETQMANLFFTPEVVVGNQLGPIKIGNYEKRRDCPAIADSSGIPTRSVWTSEAPIGFESADFEINYETCNDLVEPYSNCNVTSCEIFGTFHPSGYGVPGSLVPVYSEFLYFLNNWTSFFGIHNSVAKFQLEGFLRNLAPLPLEAPEPIKQELAQVTIVEPKKECGSILEIDNQVVGENIPVTGTPYSLYYYSDRVPGRLDKYKITIPLVRGEVPSNLTSIDVTILLAGRDFSQTFIPSKDLKYDFIWDGKDQNGKFIGSSAEAVISITNKGPGGMANSNRIRLVGGWLPRPLGLNGWIFGDVHFYDRVSKTLYLGSGGIVSNTGKPYQGGFAAPNSSGTEVYIFDSLGKHLKTINAITNNLKLKINYNANGGIASLVDNYENKTIVLHENGHASKIIAPNGQITYLEVDENGWLSKVKNPNDEIFSMSYRNKGLLGSFTKPGGQKTIMNYDAMGFLIKDQSSAGNFWAFAKDSFEDGWSIRSSTAEGRISSYEILADESGFNRKVTDSRNLTFTSVNKTIGESMEESPEGVKSFTTKRVDERFNTMAPAVSSSRVTVEGTELNYLEKNFNAYTFLEDDIFKLKSFVNKRVVGENGKTFITSYDNISRTLISVSPESRRTTTSFNQKGEVEKTTTGTLEPIVNSYDEKGRLSVVSQGNREIRMSYDGLGNLSKTIEIFGRETHFRYDASGRVVEKIFPDSSSIKLSYDKNGNVISITPPQRPAHEFTLNPFELVSQYLPPALGGKETATKYTYNLDKQLTRVDRPDGKVIQFVYDQNLGVLNSINTPNGDYQNTYDEGTGQLVKIVSPDFVELSYQYKGPLTESEGLSFSNVNASLGFEYNTDFTLKAATTFDRGGESRVEYLYDKDGLPVQIGNQKITYDNNGLMVSTTHGLLMQSSSYNEFGELVENKTYGKNKELFRLSLKRDQLGKIIQKSEAIGNEAGDVFNYVYDEKDRLIEVLKGGRTIRTYSYDANGNRTKKVEGGQVIEATYDDQDRLLRYGKNTYKYNEHGDLVEKISHEGKNLFFEYDSFGNLKKVKIGKDTIEYLIDGKNRRVGKKLNGKLVQAFIYQSQTQIAAELDSEGHIVKRFIYGSKINVPDYFISEGKEYRIISDQIGTPKLVIEAGSRKIIQKFNFDEFGILKNIDDYKQSGESKFLLPFGFAGGLIDVQTEIVRFGARDYDPSIGRWLSKDPIRFNGGDTNLYGYTLQDPINLIDPAGNVAILPVVAIIGGAGIAQGLGAAIGTIAVGGTVAEAWSAGKGGFFAGAAAGTAALGVLYFGVPAGFTATVVSGLYTLGSALTDSVDILGTDLPKGHQNYINNACRK